MFQKAFSFGVVLLLAGAALVLTAGRGLAAPGHGGFGGGSFGGSHLGGSFHGLSGFPRFGHYPHSGYRSYYWYSYPYGYYLYAPGYHYSYGYGFYSAPELDEDWGYPDVSRERPPSAAVSADNTARIYLRVPSTAEVWFNGTKTTSRGSLREFQSPRLEPGSRYAYEIRARWEENGREVAQTQEVTVTAGANVKVLFPTPAEKLAPPKPVKQD